LAVAFAESHYADGYVWADDPIAASYFPSAFHSFNRAGGAIITGRRFSPDRFFSED
jgi:hypothetical protein